MTLDADDLPTPERAAEIGAACVEGLDFLIQAGQDYFALHEERRPQAHASVVIAGWFSALENYRVMMNQRLANIGGQMKFFPKDAVIQKGLSELQQLERQFHLPDATKGDGQP